MEKPKGFREKAEKKGQFFAMLPLLLVLHKDKQKQKNSNFRNCNTNVATGQTVQTTWIAPVKAGLSFLGCITGRGESCHKGLCRQKAQFFSQGISSLFLKVPIQLIYKCYEFSSSKTENYWLFYTVYPILGQMIQNSTF